MAGQLDVSGGGGDSSGHTCAVLAHGSVRCWGFGGDGRLGYGNTSSVGDDETPGLVGPVNLGPGRTAKAISAGSYHTCALLDDGSVRCWGYGGDGRLGYGNKNAVGDDEAPGSVGPVNLGPGHTAKAITAGGGHSCAILDDGSVRCWGFGGDGRLGYGNRDSIGDDEAPGSVGPVDLGPGRTATAISAGASDTCAILDDGAVRCWGRGNNGQLGYGDTLPLGTSQTPGSVAPVELGPGRTAKAISAGAGHTCAVLDDGSVRCWGYGGNGRLGYGNTSNVGDLQVRTPDKAGPVDLGPGRTAKAISAGDSHTCAILDDNSVRCWGYGAYGELGYANTKDVGDKPATTPDKMGPVDLGPGRTAKTISAGGRHTCAMLDDNSVRCWGFGGDGRLGYCNTNNVGDHQTPGSVGPVDLLPGRGAHCAGGRGGPKVNPLRLQALRAERLHSCLARAARRPKRQRSRAGGACLKRYGRTPGRITKLRAGATSRTTVILTFAAPGSDGQHPPAARAYLVKQSRRPIRGEHDFQNAHTLCNGP